jgi:hypothetical protein
MNDYDPTSADDTNAASGPSVSETSGGADATPPPPPASSPNEPASAAMAKQTHRLTPRRFLSNRKGRWIVAATLCAVIGVSSYAATSASATATSPTATAGQGASGSGAGGGPRFGGGGGGSNARSGPAAGGSSGTVTSVSTSKFTISTSAGQKVTVNETSSTTYQKGTTSTGASAITKGEPVLVLGTTSGTTIKATQVTVQPTGSGGSATSTAAGVIPFQRGTTTTSKQVGQIPADYSQGSGTIVGGTTANKATEAALAAYPGGVVDRVVQLSNGQFEVHYIGVNWPHHIFVNQEFQVVGAN